jgi:hypothetical protein
LWYAPGFVTLFLFVPHLIRSQDKAVPSAAPSSASSTSAPKEQVNALAARLADAIAHSKNGTVIVFDFVGPDRRLGPLGAVLADDLSTALAATPARLHVQDHSRLKMLMGENSLESENIFDPGIATWLAEDLGAQALVLGKLERDAGNVKLSVTSYSVRDGRGIVGFEITLPLTDEMKGLIPIPSRTRLPTNLCCLLIEDATRLDCRPAAA